jgi:hypothetical protein
MLKKLRQGLMIGTDGACKVLEERGLRMLEENALK